MAERTRRERRFDADRQKSFAPKAAPAESPTLDIVPAAGLTEEFVPAPMRVSQAAPMTNRKAAALVNFAQEYYYEYSELSHILIITAILFVVMIGLSFFI